MMRAVPIAYHSLSSHCACGTSGSLSDGLGGCLQQAFVQVSETLHSLDDDLWTAFQSSRLALAVSWS